jgi:hypothetical protein
MTNLEKADKTYTVAELREIVRKMEEIIDELRELSNRMHENNSLENNREFERLVRKFFEMNAIVHTAPANMELREILRHEREQQERS